jgi:hypothetical protein
MAGNGISGYEKRRGWIGYQGVALQRILEAPESPQYDPAIAQRFSGIRGDRQFHDKSPVSILKPPLPQRDDVEQMHRLGVTPRYIENLPTERLRLGEFALPKKMQRLRHHSLGLINNPCGRRLKRGCGRNWFARAISIGS